MPQEKISCRGFVELVGAYRDGGLPANQARAFESHLARCPKCREYLTSYQATVSLTRRAIKDPDERSADSVPEDLVESIMRARTRRK